MDHKAVNHPVEQQTIIERAEGEFGEVVAMLGRFGIQFNLDRSHAGHEIEYRFFRQLGEFIHDFSGFDGICLSGFRCLGFRCLGFFCGFLAVFATGYQQGGSGQAKENKIEGFHMDEN